MMFWAACDKAKRAEQATQATEAEPFVETEKTAVVQGKAATPAPLPVRLRQVFGGFSAAVGIVVVTAHLFTGRVGVTAVIACTLGVPLCIVFGFYLMTKAQEPAKTEREKQSDSLSPLPKNVATSATTATIGLNAVHSETEVTLRQQ